VNMEQKDTKQIFKEKTDITPFLIDWVKTVEKKIKEWGYGVKVHKERFGISIIVDDGAPTWYKLWVSNNEKEGGRFDLQAKGPDLKQAEDILRHINITYRLRGGNVYYHSSAKVFDAFDNACIKELGFHVGSHEQAVENFKRLKLEEGQEGEKIGYLYECKLKKNHFFGDGMADLGDWSYEMLDEYFNPKRENYEVFTKKEWDVITDEKTFVEAMKEKGYDGISYINQFEHCEDNIQYSYIIFDAKDLEIMNIFRCTFRDREKRTMEKPHINQQRREKSGRIL